MPMVTFDSKQETNNVQQEKCTPKSECPETPQTHVHEFLGSTKLAEENGDRHNHRFAGVTTEKILVPGGHIHAFMVNTDFLDHHHEIGGTTGLQIPVGNGKHVHFASSRTTCDDGHNHEFQFATLIDSPLV